MLRVLRRLNDANNPLQPDDWDYVQIHTDRVLATALYCDRLGIPPAYAETLEAGLKAGGYHATHVLLAWIWLQDNRCKLAVRDGFVEDMYRANSAILDDRPTIVNDLKLEAAAFLCMARQGKRVDPRFIRHVVLNPKTGRGETRHFRTRPTRTSRRGTPRPSPCCSCYTWNSQPSRHPARGSPTGKIVPQKNAAGRSPPPDIKNRDRSEFEVHADEEPPAQRIVRRTVAGARAIHQGTATESRPSEGASDSGSGTADPCRARSRCLRSTCSDPGT